MVKEILEEIAGAFSQGYRSSRNWTNPRSGTVQGLPRLGSFFCQEPWLAVTFKGVSFQTFLSPDWLGLVVLINTAVIAPFPIRRSETGMAASDADQRDKARRQRGNNSGRDLVSEQAWSQFQYLFARSSSPTTIAPMADSSRSTAAICSITNIRVNIWMQVVHQGFECRVHEFRREHEGDCKCNNGPPH